MLLYIEPVNLLTEQNHHRLQQRTEKPEVREAQDRQAENSVAREITDTFDNVAPGIQPDPCGGGGGGDPRNAEAGDETNRRDRDDEHTDEPEAIAPRVEQ